MKDRLVLGSNSTYLFISFPSERSVEDWSRYDYDYFQSELAAAEGFHIQSLCDDQAHRKRWIHWKVYFWLDSFKFVSFGFIQCYFSIIYALL